tara:strand:- start:205 stop:321 length:117 start_codon:yes stop_codon:yes gene_type:complete
MSYQEKERISEENARNRMEEKIRFKKKQRVIVLFPIFY